MMKKGLIISGLLVLLLAIAAVGLTACAGSSPLVGKWQYAEEDVYLEFFNDGQFEMGMIDESIVYSGTYEETGDKEVTLTLSSVNGEAVDAEELAVLEYSFSGDELTLDDGDEPVTFTRME
jgi:hypothetical protein